MTTIVRWDPLKEMTTLQDRMNRVFEETWGRTRRAEEDYVTGSWMPAVDVRETKEAVEIQAELPGIDPKDVNVSVEGGVLTIKGSRQFEKATEGETYHRVERAYGSFERSFTLPTSGIIISGCGRMPSACTFKAASMIARTCIAERSG